MPGFFTSRRRRTLLLAAAAAALGLIALAALPRVLGTRWVYGPLLERLATEDFQVEVAAVRLGWFRPPELEGLAVLEPAGAALLEVDRVVSDRSLLRLLLGGRQLGRMRLESPRINLTVLEEGTNYAALVRALDDRSRRDAPPADRLPPVDVEIEIAALQIEVRRDGVPRPMLQTAPSDFVVRYLATGEQSLIELPAARLLPPTELERELFAFGLEYLLPPLAGATWIDGAVALEIDGASIPLEDPQGVVASGRLEILRVQSGLQSPLLQRITERLSGVLGRPLPTRLVLAEGSQVAFRVEEARVWHEGLRFGLPEWDERMQFVSEGFVHFDRRIELALDVPLPLEWLARREAVQQLGVPTLRLNVTGTLDEPRIDWSEATAGLGELLGEIRERLGDDAAIRSGVVSAVEQIVRGEGRASEAVGAAAEAVGAAADLLRRRREARREAAEDAPRPAEVEDLEAPEDPEAAPRRGLFRRLLPGRGRAATPPN